MVANLFGRIRDVRKWSHSQASDYKQRKKDEGYAQRTALNHPIQSTCADLLKIAMIRVDDWIQEQGLNPLSGQAITNQLLPQQSYRDFKAGELNSVHDEVVFLIHDELFDELICSIYEIMQTKDVVRALGGDFDLELDCEYDQYRSWTAQEAYLGSRIFFINSRMGNQSEDPPNAYVVNQEDLTCDLMERINTEPSRGEFHLAVEVENGQFGVHDQLFSSDFIEGLGIKYRKVCLINP